MNKMWGIIFFVLPVIGIGYSFWRTWQLLPFGNVARIITLVIMAVCIFMFFANFGIWNIDKWPMPIARAAYEVGNSSLFILLYLVMLYLVMDLGQLCHLIPREWTHQSWKGTIAVATIMIGIFTYGYFNYLNKVRQPLQFTTKKKLEKPMKIVMLSDLHIGYHNNVEELNRWIRLINAENADFIVIGGDIIDGHIRPIIDENMAASFRQLNAPVYACLGNHEYYSGIPGAQQFYKDANINLLIDSVVTVKGINIIGRDDRSNMRRKPLNHLMEGVDLSRYTILLDHQPYNLEKAEKAKIDFQLSGHTHYGQVWPVNWIEDRIYEDAYGPLQKSNTQYFVTSGIGIWGAKFRIGTRSEYLVVELKN